MNVSRVNELELLAKVRQNGKPKYDIRVHGPKDYSELVQYHVDQAKRLRAERIDELKTKIYYLRKQIKVAKNDDEISQAKDSLKKYRQRLIWTVESK